jgi:hypothetical protein
MLLCLSLVVFVHGFSKDQLLCLFVYLSLFLFMVSHRTNSYASLFIFCSFCSWFFSQNQLLCFFVYLLLWFVHGFSHRTNSYASLFISYCVCSWFLTEPTPMLLCLSCILFMVSHFLALTTLTVPGNGYIHFTRSTAFLSYSKKE